MWTEVPHGGKKKAKPVNKDRILGEDRGTCQLCVGIKQYNTPPPEKKTRKPGLVLDLFTLGAKHWIFLDIK